MKQLTLALRYLALNAKKHMYYRIHFLFWIVTSFLEIGVRAFFWWVLFQNITVFPGWDFNSLMVLMALANMTISLQYMLIGFSTNWCDAARSGELDQLFSRPVPLLTTILFRYPYLPASMGVISNLVVIMAIFMTAGIQVPPFSLVLAGLFISEGLIVSALFSATMSIIVIMSPRMGEIVDNIYAIYDITKPYPLTIYPLFLNIFLSFCLPLGLMQMFPTMVLLGRMDMPMTLSLLGVGLLLICVWARVYSMAQNWMVRGYESAGG